MNRLRTYSVAAFMLIGMVHAACAQETAAYFRSAFTGTLEDVKHHLTTGINIDTVDAGGQTALHKAAHQSHAHLVGYLLQEGADPNIPDKQRVTPLIAATVSYPTDQDVRAILQIVTDLIAHGAEVNAQDAGGMTALMLAAAAEFADVVKTLLEHGADKTLTNNFGQRAIDFANDGGPSRKLLEETVQDSTSDDDK